MRLKIPLAALGRGQRGVARRKISVAVAEIVRLLVRRGSQIGIGDVHARAATVHVEKRPVGAIEGIARRLAVKRGERAATEGLVVGEVPGIQHRLQRHAQLGLRRAQVIGFSGIAAVTVKGRGA